MSILPVGGSSARSPFSDPSPISIFVPILPPPRPNTAGKTWPSPSSPTGIAQTTRYLGGGNQTSHRNSKPTPHPESPHPTSPQRAPNPPQPQHQSIFPSSRQPPLHPQTSSLLPAALHQEAQSPNADSTDPNRMRAESPPPISPSILHPHLSNPPKPPTNQPTKQNRPMPLRRNPALLTRRRKTYHTKPHPKSSTAPSPPTHPACSETHHQISAFTLQ